MKRLLLLASLSTWLAHGAWAQSLCASDGQATPLTLVERFISADCEACWSAPQTLKPAAGALTLDWIVPSEQGEAAPLSAAASRDALMRLEALGRAAPTASFITSTQIVGDRGVKSNERAARGENERATYYPVRYYLHRAGERVDFAAHNVKYRR